MSESAQTQNSQLRPSPAQNSLSRPSQAQNLLSRPSQAQNSLSRPFPAQNSLSRPFPAQNSLSRPFPAQNSLSRPSVPSSKFVVEAVRPQLKIRCRGRPEVKNRRLRLSQRTRGRPKGPEAVLKDPRPEISDLLLEIRTSLSPFLRLASAALLQAAGNLVAGLPQCRGEKIILKKIF